MRCIWDFSGYLKSEGLKVGGRVGPKMGPGGRPDALARGLCLARRLYTSLTDSTRQKFKYVHFYNQVDCVNTTGSASACAKTWYKSNTSNANVAILKISELTEDDQNHLHILKIKNHIGRQLLQLA